MTEPTRVKVKRDGPRGWHWITAASFDPSKHELADQPPQTDPQPTEAETKKRGRPRKQPLEN